MSVSSYIKQLLEFKHLTLTDLAKETGISRNTLADYHIGRVASFSIDSVNKLSEYLEIPASKIWYDACIDGLEDAHSLIAYRYLSEIFLRNYSVKVNPIIKCSQPVTTNGFYIKKRQTNSGCVIESWQKVVNRFNSAFKDGLNVKDMFTSNNEYILSAYRYSAELITSTTDSRVSSYDIIFSLEDTVAYEYLIESQKSSKKTNVSLVLLGKSEAELQKATPAYCNRLFNNLDKVSDNKLYQAAMFLITYMNDQQSKDLDVIKKELKVSTINEVQDILMQKKHINKDWFKLPFMNPYFLDENQYFSIIDTLQ